MNIYLDINQVLKTSNNKLSLYADEFLKTVSRHEVYWLTADYNGNIDVALSHLVQLLNHEQRNVITLIGRTE